MVTTPAPITWADVQRYNKLGLVIASKAVLTDPVRPAAPMERLRGKWPHTLVLDFDPEGGRPGVSADLERLAAASDPAEICGLFVEFTSGGPPDDGQRAVLRAAVEAAQHAEAAV